MKILITGASGFIGSHLAEEALRQGHEVWCAVRKTTSRKYLKDERLNFLEINLSSAEQMAEALKPHRFDAVVHAAGATKCPTQADFYRTNTDGTRNLVSVLEQQYADTDGFRFVFVSSLSVVNSIPEEKLGEPTAYGESKLKAEEVVRNSKLKWVVLRPTGVYGPREKDYFLMVKSIKQHTDFAVAAEQILTFVYVDDVVQAVMLALTRPEADVIGGIYPLSDGKEYSSVTFSDLIIDNIEQLEGRRPKVLRIKAPLWLMRLVCWGGELFNRCFARNNPKRLVTLNNDKYNILTQNDWRCDISATRSQLGYEPKVQLEEGVRRTVKWYKENGWI